MTGTEIATAIAGATGTAMTADILTAIAMTAGTTGDMITTADMIAMTGAGMDGAGGTGTVIAGNKESALTLL